MKKIINISIMLLALLTVTSFCFAQDIAENEEITKYLESTIEYRSRVIVSSASQKVSGLDISESKLTFNTGQKISSIIQEQYFIKSGDKLTPYRILNDMLSSSEFIESIKIKEFKLNTEEDGVAFQSMLKLIDYEGGLGFFKENNIWYFIRSKFFDDIEAYVVTTDEKGQISSVVYEEKLNMELPKTLQKSGEIDQIGDSNENSFSKNDSIYMHNYLLDDLDFVFEISPNSLSSVNEITTISIFKCALKITDEFTILKDPFLLVVNDDEYIKQSSVDKVVQMPLFVESLKEKYKINTKEDAKLFLNVLDDLELFSRSDNDPKDLYKKGDMWIFVRKKHFDDLEGYVLLLDKDLKVSYIEYTAISDENIAIIKLNNATF